ncbi:hypothetical protein Syun_020547 [Stephania yunnanensis]|uniref:Uncharacterized protein n=1 Tax=Stephania yunnanensis TaxID=152371 RepID=A0AAP0IEE2_9MAGN
MPKSVKHGKQSLLLSKDLVLDTEGSKYSDSSSIPKDGFSRLLDLIQVSHNVDENSTYYDHSQLLKRLHVVIFSPDDKLQFGIDESYKLTVPSTGNPICAHLELSLYEDAKKSNVTCHHFYIPLKKSPVLDAAFREGAVIIDHWFIGCSGTYVVYEGLHIHRYFGRTNDLVTIPFTYKQEDLLQHGNPYLPRNCDFDEKRVTIEESSNALLAISFWFPIIENEPFLPMNYALEGSTVGFCNLIKRARDQLNHLWVAEATDNSTYSLLNDLPTSSHLNEAAGAANRWAKISSLAIKKLKEKVLFIIGDRGSCVWNPVSQVVHWQVSHGYCYLRHESVRVGRQGSRPKHEVCGYFIVARARSGRQVSRPRSGSMDIS